jgi:hypothetical protein
MLMNAFGKGAKAPPGCQVGMGFFCFFAITDFASDGLSPPDATKSGKRGDRDERTTEGR